ncbi:hypothetical protein N865_04715 [Intrasporangium oryzae NRRL B-24470]|uniref:Uncharacterized protein n=1 Tax=Intrasporangium oryzae NRRL B-24470 TaxID=1386089 RepID=W9GD30_9MICO|nr:hypothetical protein N865_04715 [Intrasporangium oryzae NRRL B-24470]
MQRLERHTEPVDDLGRDLEGALSQGASLGRQRDGEGTVVGGVALTRDEAARLEPLEQRREGGRLEADQLADLAHGERRALPEGEHHEVLRVGQPEGLEDRPVEADHGPRRDGEGEAHLLIEPQQVVGIGPARRLPDGVPDGLVDGAVDGAVDRVGSGSGLHPIVLLTLVSAHGILCVH